ncbi:MAG: hypothetical protein AAF660_00695 [Pseudomonadota bacterium]
MEIGFLKAVAFSGPLLVFLLWQLYSVNREIDEDNRSNGEGDD